MLDQDFSLKTESRAGLVSIVCPTLSEHSDEIATKRSLDELHELMKTLKIPCVESYYQNVQHIRPGTFLGSGKLLEIAEDAKSKNCNLLVFDFELSASQVKNIKKLTGLPIIDRNHIILEIFAQHAHTREAKIQIEIAKLNYILPRLSGMWEHLSRQRSARGAIGGEGEQQIELDRRIIRDKIALLKKEIVHLEKSRTEQKKKRLQTTVKAALVGYTNAGKSSLMNRLCQVNVLEEDKLFATLDSTYRMLNPDTRPPMILIDTVGFISNLPNTLIEGFKTTLESALEADLLLIVADISDPHLEKHIEVTKNVLSELKIGQKETIIVLNKKDLMPDVLDQKMIKRKFPNSIVVSSFDKNDIDELRTYIVNFFLSKQEHYDIFVPYEKGNEHSIVVSKTNVRKSSHHEKGIFYRICAPSQIMAGLGLQEYILAPNDPLREKLGIKD